MDFDEITRSLYALSPDEFVGARDRAATEARTLGDPDLSRRLHALRKPTLAAWGLNQMAGEQPQTVNQLLALGLELREAWTQAQGEELRELSARRREVVYTLAELVRQLAHDRGHPLTEDSVQDVRHTLDAALADPRVAREVGSGRLTRAHSYAGFGPPEAAPPALRDEDKRGPEPAGTPQAQRASARLPSVRPPPDADQTARRRRADREQLSSAVREAEAAAEAAERDVAVAVETLAEVEAEVDATEQEITRLTEQLDAARHRLGETQLRRRVLRRDRDAVRKVAAAARHRAERIRARLNILR